MKLHVTFIAQIKIIEYLLVFEILHLIKYMKIKKKTQL